jgi:hypothetical protein
MAGFDALWSYIANAFDLILLLCRSSVPASTANAATVSAPTRVVVSLYLERKPYRYVLYNREEGTSSKPRAKRHTANAYSSNTSDASLGADSYGLPTNLAVPPAQRQEQTPPRHMATTTILQQAPWVGSVALSLILVLAGAAPPTRYSRAEAALNRRETARPSIQRGGRPLPHVRVRPLRRRRQSRFLIQVDRHRMVETTMYQWPAEARMMTRARPSH